MISSLLTSTAYACRDGHELVSFGKNPEKKSEIVK